MCVFFKKSPAGANWHLENQARYILYAPVSPHSHLCRPNTYSRNTGGKSEIPATHSWAALGATALNVCPQSPSCSWVAVSCLGRASPCWLCQVPQSSAHPIVSSHPPAAVRVRQGPRCEGCTALQGSQNSLLKQQQRVVSRVQLLSLYTKHSFLFPLLHQKYKVSSISSYSCP